MTTVQEQAPSETQVEQDSKVGEEIEKVEDQVGDAAVVEEKQLTEDNPVAVENTPLVDEVQKSEDPKVEETPSGKDKEVAEDIPSVGGNHVSDVVEEKQVSEVEEKQVSEDTQTTENTPAEAPESIEENTDVQEATIVEVFSLIATNGGVLSEVKNQ